MSDPLSAEALNPYWCSFYGPEDLHAAFEYHGPWWTSGYDGEGNLTIVAAVMATDEDAAMETLRLAYDADRRPAALVSRFCRPFEEGGRPYSSRFPAADWMQWPWPVKPLEPRP